MLFLTAGEVRVMLPFDESLYNVAMKHFGSFMKTSIIGRRFGFQESFNGG